MDFFEQNSMFKDTKPDNILFYITMIYFLLLKLQI